MAKEEKSASALENRKIHNEEQPSGVQARELRSDEYAIAPRHVSDEELSRIERESQEVSAPATEDSNSYDGTSVKAADVVAGAAPSRDSADYLLRDVKGTTIVGYQEQVPRSEVEG